MNDFERRLADVMKTAPWIAAVLPNPENIIGMEFFNYNVQIPAVAVGASGQATIQIQSDSHFAATYMSGATTVGGVIVSNPQTFVQLTDTGTGKTFFNIPALFPLVMGIGGQPFYLPMPRLSAPNTSINVNVSVTAAAGAVTFDINLFGSKVFYRG